MSLARPGPSSFALCGLIPWLGTPHHSCLPRFPRSCSRSSSSCLHRFEGVVRSNCFNAFFTLRCSFSYGLFLNSIRYSRISVFEYHLPGTLYPRCLVSGPFCYHPFVIPSVALEDSCPTIRFPSVLFLFVEHEGAVWLSSVDCGRRLPSWNFIALHTFGSASACPPGFPPSVHP